MALVFGSFTMELVVVLVTLAVMVYFWSKKKYRYFEDRDIPYVKPKSLLDNNLRAVAMSKSLGEIYDDLYQELKRMRADYGGFFMMLSPGIVVTSPDLVNTILTSDFQHFSDHGLPVDEELNPIEANLFFLSGPKWKALRRKLSPTFTSGKLKWMFGLIDECAESLVSLLKSQTGSQLEVRDVLARFTTDVIGSCAFGVDSNSLKDPNSMFRKMGEKFFNPPISAKFLSIFRFTVPSLIHFLKIKTSSSEVENFFFSMNKQVMDRRQSSGEVRTDFVQLLLELKTKGYVKQDPADDEELEAEINSQESDQDKLELTDNLLAAQAFVFFIAGFETTSSAISFALYLLAKHPDSQEKVRQDVRKYGTSYDGLSSMTYLDSVIDESMRMYPAIQILPRVCSKPYIMPDGKLIEKGTRFMIPIYSIHHDPDIYPDPEEFKPERFAPGERTRPGTYLPFGDGPRICIGRRFALLEAKLSIAKILDAFQVSVGPKTKEPLTLRTHAFVVRAEGGLWLKFDPLDK